MRMNGFRRDRVRRGRDDAGLTRIAHRSPRWMALGSAIACRAGCCLRFSAPVGGTGAERLNCPGDRISSRRAAGVAQWQSRSFPSLRRGFDSLHPLHPLS